MSAGLQIIADTQPSDETLALIMYNYTKMIQGLLPATYGFVNGSDEVTIQSIADTAYRAYVTQQLTINMLFQTPLPRKYQCVRVKKTVYTNTVDQTYLFEYNKNLFGYNAANGVPDDPTKSLYIPRSRYTWRYETFYERVRFSEDFGNYARIDVLEQTGSWYNDSSWRDGYGNVHDGDWRMRVSDQFVGPAGGDYVYPTSYAETKLAPSFDYVTVEETPTTFTFSNGTLPLNSEIGWWSEGDSNHVGLNRVTRGLGYNIWVNGQVSDVYFPHAYAKYMDLYTFTQALYANPSWLCGLIYDGWFNDTQYLKLIYGVGVGGINNYLAKRIDDPSNVFRKRYVKTIEIELKRIYNESPWDTIGFYDWQTGTVVYRDSWDVLIGVGFGAGNLGGQPISMIPRLNALPVDFIDAGNDFSQSDTHLLGHNVGWPNIYSQPGPTYSNSWFSSIPNDPNV